MISLRLVLQGEPLAPRPCRRRWSSRADVVGDDVVQLAGEVQPHAVGEVAAVGEVEAEDGVAGLEQRGHRRGVGLRARVRLHVGVLGAEQRLDPVDRQLLDDVDVLAAAVVAAARVALGVLVGQHRALRLHHRRAGAKFSLAIISRVDCCRRSSSAIAACTSGPSRRATGAGRGPGRPHDLARGGRPARSAGRPRRGLIGHCRRARSRRPPSALIYQLCRSYVVF